MWNEGSWKRRADAQASSPKSILNFNKDFLSHPLPDNRSPWTISLISLNKRSCSLENHVPMKKESTDLPLFLLTLVFSPLTSISTEARLTTGALAVTPRSLHSVMVNASGSSLDADLFLSTSLSLDTTSSATASCHPTLPSVMELTSTCWSGYTSTTEASGGFGESSVSGVVSVTGPSLSTSDCTQSGSLLLHLYLNSLSNPK